MIDQARLAARRSRVRLAAVRTAAADEPRGNKLDASSVLQRSTQEAPPVAETDKHASDAPSPCSEAERSRRFQQVALPHLDAAYNLARWLSGSAGDAEDIVQEAFMRAFRFFDSFHGDNARPWLLAIVRRTWYTEWQRRANSREVAPLDDALDQTSVFEPTCEGFADPQALLLRGEHARLVHEALASLPVEFREVLILRELEEMAYRDIAAITDLPIGTVMSRLARGRRKLAALLAPLVEEGRAGAQRFGKESSDGLQ
ncbi:RNA polymerase sigma factor [Trinickia sp. Y13]|uniref:RNA polymerase sigma factor n=1 Tax=Trinickia sp. Y13 TaxID=2917807 RepID=UPI0024076ABE|nr:RNA polymerase sigma factor [Trinickia sp. Y13]MDG0026296.1 RNA polymerase sigma factor [Trinickia sp. Y13]